MGQASRQMVITDRKGVGELLEALRREGFELIGPRVEQGAIQYRPIDSVNDMPTGFIDEQGPGHYRLAPDTSHPDSLFRYTVGPGSWKAYLHPPRQELWRATRRDHNYRLSVDESPPPRYAFVGVRACELAAMDIQARVFADSLTGYGAYGEKREHAFVLAVNCSRVGHTCFCTRVQDETGLDGSEATRTLHWDSCFNPEFSYMHGGALRRSIGARYRQWISHKLAYWHDQFGLSGCTGCGRCITWCPVGIGITQEVRVLGATQAAQTSGSGEPKHG